jgi:glycosyltransferase involved in cell wall biosynthesis
MTDPLGQSQVIPYLQGLSKKGYRFTLISFEKIDRYQKYAKVIGKLLAPFDIAWAPLKYHKLPPVLSTLFDMWLMWIKTKRLHQQESFQIIHCRSYLAALIGLRMKRKYGTKFIFDMRGFWADERVEGGLWNLKNPVFRLVYNYFKAKETEFLEEADFTISLTHAAKQEILSWPTLKSNSLSIEVIPCCADLQHFNRQNVRKDDSMLLRNKLGITEAEFVLVYLGSLGTWYKLDEMLRFFKVLLTYKPHAKFLILTKDVDYPLFSLIDEIGIPEEKIVLQSAERQEVPTYLSLSHLAIFFYHPTFSKKATSPTKQGELMGMGIPIICNAGVGDTSMIIRESDSGVVIEEFSESSYIDICQNLEKILSMPLMKIVESASDIYSLDRGVEGYARVYEKIQ